MAGFNLALTAASARQALDCSLKESPSASPMATNIKRPETVRDAREQDITSPQGLAHEILEIGRRCAALPDLNTRSADEILGYDRHGLPR